MPHRRINSEKKSVSIVFSVDATDLTVWWSPFQASTSPTYHFAITGTYPMMIGPFQRSRKDWLLVVGLRSFPVDDLAMSPPRVFDGSHTILDL